MKAICIFPECATIYPVLLGVYVQRAVTGRMDDQKEILDEAMQDFGGTDDAVNHLREMFKDYAHLIVQRDRLQLMPVDHEERTPLDLWVAAQRKREVLDAILEIERELVGIGKKADTTHRRTCDICNS